MAEPKLRTLDDVKEGDELEELTFKDREIVIGRSGGAVMTSPKSTSTVVNVRSLDYIKKNYKLADQPAERWKPEENEWYEHVDEFGKVNEASWRDDYIDNKRWNLGNCFKKGSGEAEKAAEELKGWWGNRINNQKLK